jgi:flagellar protein FlgJ
MDIPAINKKFAENINSVIKNKSTDGSFEKRLKSVMDENNKQELKKACKEFEEIMLNMMYRQMKATVPKSPFYLDFTYRTKKNILEKKKTHTINIIILY